MVNNPPGVYDLYTGMLTYSTGTYDLNSTMLNMSSRNIVPFLHDAEHVFHVHMAFTIG
jgi:hypothetical protein